MENQTGVSAPRTCTSSYANLCTSHSRAVCSVWASGQLVKQECLRAKPMHILAISVTPCQWDSEL